MVSGNTAHEAAGAVHGEVEMKIKFGDDGKQILRTFTRQEDWDRAADLLERPNFLDRMLRALGKIHSGFDPGAMRTVVTPERLHDAFQSEGRVQWYWAEFLSRIREELHGQPTIDASAPRRNPEFVIHLQGCCEYNFYALLGDTNAGGPSFVHSPFFQSSAPPDAPAELKPEAPEMRGLADTVLFLAPRLCELRDGQYNLADELSWFDVRCAIEVTEPQRGRQSDSMSLIVRWTVAPPNRVVSTPNGNEVLVTSPNVRHAIKSLEEAWLDERAKCVLVSAGSGAGKEVLVSLLGDAVRAGKRRAQIAAPEVGKMEVLSTRLDGLRLPQRPRDEIGKPDTNTSAGRRPLLFLDEIHHDGAADIRSGLLRLLESNALDIHGSSEVRDCSSLLYVLAASRSAADLRASVKPIDLWTRVEYVVQMQHPLAVEPGRRAEILGDYFDMFWKLAREKWNGCDLPPYVHAKVRLTLGEDAADETKLKEIVRERFCTDLEMPRPSMRELRTIVKRLYGRTVTLIRTREISTPGEMKDLETKLAERCGDWMRELSGELLPANSDF